MTNPEGITVPSDNANDAAPLPPRAKSLQQGKPGPKKAAADTGIRKPIQKAIREETREPVKSDIKRAEKVVRRKRDTEEEDPLYIDPKMIPDGFSVEWKRVSCYGKSETTYLVKLQRQGWEPAPVDKFRFLVGDEYEGKAIVIDGMMLMMRPQELTDEARQEDYDIAKNMVGNKLKQVQQTPDGNMQRKVTAFNRTYERAPVPEDK